ncbi:MAG: hypothetical protein AAFR11_11855 [Pseudomonadota bacterium]
MLDEPMSPFTLSVDGSLATITYVRETEDCAADFMTVLNHAIDEGADNILLDKGDLKPAAYEDAAVVGKTVAAKLLRHDARLAVVLRNDDHETKIALAIAAQDGAAVLVGESTSEAYGWLRGDIR